MANPMNIDDLPVLGICGWSGSGKTTLLEALIPRLREQGLCVAVVKHETHGLDVDREGKDSDRFFRAGADVLLEGSGEAFARRHRTEREPWIRALGPLLADHDLVLVEGHKRTPIRKIWLLNEGEAAPPEDVEGIEAVLGRDCDRLAEAAELIEAFVKGQWMRMPLCACVLAEKAPPSAECLKTLRQVASKVVVVAEDPRLIGSADACLPPVPDATGGVSGILAAMRWAPRACWLVVAGDGRGLEGQLLSRLMSMRRPGVWAVLTKSDRSDLQSVLPGIFAPPMREVLEQPAGEGASGLDEITSHPKVVWLDSR